MAQGQPIMGDERDPLLAELFAIHDEMETHLKALMQPLPVPSDLTMQQMRVLEIVYRTSGLSTHELSEQLHVSAPTASGLVERLVEKGLLERVEDAKDRRVRRLAATAAGRELVITLQSVFDRLLTRVISYISVDDLELLKDTSHMLLKAVIKASREADNGESF